MSHLYAAIAETKHVSLALLKIQRAVLNTAIQFCILFTKLQSRYRSIVNSKLPVTKVQVCLIYNVILYSLLT